MTHLVAAVISGLVTTAASSPIDVIKTRVMTEISRGAMFNGPVDCIVKSVKAEGVAVLYRGFMPNYMRIGARRRGHQCRGRLSLTHTPCPRLPGSQALTLSWCADCAAPSCYALPRVLGLTRGGPLPAPTPPVLPPAGVLAQPIWRWLYVGRPRARPHSPAAKPRLWSTPDRGHSLAPVLPLRCVRRSPAPKERTRRKCAGGRDNGFPQLRHAAAMWSELHQAPHDHAPAAPTVVLAQVEGLWPISVEAGPPRPAPVRFHDAGVQRGRTAGVGAGPYAAPRGRPPPPRTPPRYRSHSLIRRTRTTRGRPTGCGGSSTSPTAPM